MIQRIQTVWLLLAAAIVFFTIRLSFYVGTDSINLTPKTLNGTTNLFILILSSALGTCILVTIFLFRQRKLQIRLVWVCIVAECLIIYLYYRQISSFAEGELTIWSILHPVVLVLLVLAVRGIYKDARLIKESNRLR
jgi:peptidoglycan/LPS O-acetylase OafA/YrhL